jgi:hypothetical protein
VEGKELRQANEEETRQQLVAALGKLAQFDSSKVANGAALPKLPSDINSILVYNIAAMSYQTQNYGQALLYLKLVLENLDQVEEFIAIKSMFLLLQVLWELKMRYAAAPVIDMLEAKICEIEKLIEQKRQIKANQISTG